MTGTPPRSGDPFEGPPGSRPLPPGGYGYSAPNDGNAIAALVLAILSFVVCPVVPAIVALILASSATQRIEASGGAVGGEGLVTAARVVAWLNIGFAALGLIVLVAAAGLASSPNF